MRLSGPADMLAVLPYQLGYHPARSVLVVSMRQRRMGLVQRLDLPAAQYAAPAAATLLGPLLRDEPSGVVLIGYEATAGSSRPVLDALAAVCAEHGLEVLDRLVVCDGRWRSLDCEDPGCCPSAGGPLPAAADVPAVADYVAREVAPLADRAALADRLAPARPLLQAAVQAAALLRLGDRTAAIDAQAAGDPLPLLAARRVDLAIWSRVLGDGGDSDGRTGDGRLIGDGYGELAGRSQRQIDAAGDLEAADLARLAVSLRDLDLRDALIAWTCQGWIGLDVFEPSLVEALAEALPGRCVEPVDPSAAQAAAQLRVESRLARICACLPSAWAAGPLCVLASRTWWRGDGAATRVALDRALEIDPAYRLAQLMTRMVDMGVRPGELSG